MNSIPNDTKTQLALETRDTSPKQSLLNKLLSAKEVNKMLYNLQIKQTEVEVKQKQKWENIIEKHDIEWKPILN